MPGIFCFSALAFWIFSFLSLHLKGFLWSSRAFVFSQICAGPRFQALDFTFLEDATIIFGVKGGSGRFVYERQLVKVDFRFCILYRIIVYIYILYS